jgi:hypothetical protein
MRCSAGRGQEKDEVHAVLAKLRGNAPAFLRRIVHNQQPVNPGIGRCLDKGATRRSRLVALVEPLDGVCVSHQDHWSGSVLLSENAHHLQNLEQTDASGERLVAGLLDHGAVGARIGKRHPEFQDVGSGGDHSMHQLGRDIDKREARCDIGDECGSAARVERGHRGRNSAHGRAPAPWTVTTAPPLTACPWQLGRQ